MTLRTLSIGIYIQTSGMRTTSPGFVLSCTSISRQFTVPRTARNGISSMRSR